MGRESPCASRWIKADRDTVPGRTSGRSSLEASRSNPGPGSRADSRLRTEATPSWAPFAVLRSPGLLIPPLPGEPGPRRGRNLAQCYRLQLPYRAGAAGPDSGAITGCPAESAPLRPAELEHGVIPWAQLADVAGQ